MDGRHQLVNQTPPVTFSLGVKFCHIYLCFFLADCDDKNSCILKSFQTLKFSEIILYQPTWNAATSSYPQATESVSPVSNFRWYPAAFDCFGPSSPCSSTALAHHRIHSHTQPTDSCQTVTAQKFPSAERQAIRKHK